MRRSLGEISKELLVPSTKFVKWQCSSLLIIVFFIPCFLTPCSAPVCQHQQSTSRTVENLSTKRPMKNKQNKRSWAAEYNLCGLSGVAFRKMANVHVKIAFVPICACKNSRRIWRHNASTSRSLDVTDHPWWRHKAKSENTILVDNGEMSVRYFFRGMVCSGHYMMLK